VAVFELGRAARADQFGNIGPDCRQRFGAVPSVVDDHAIAARNFGQHGTDHIFQQCCIDINVMIATVGIFSGTSADIAMPIEIFASLSLTSSKSSARSAKSIRLPFTSP
jgi:hypothetical protein